MKITKIKIKKISALNGLIGFCSFVIDGWLFVGNIAIFSRMNREGEVRLVFPEKKVDEKIFRLCHPLSSDKYYELEKVIKDNFYKI